MEVNTTKKLIYKQHEVIFIHVKSGQSFDDHFIRLFAFDDWELHGNTKKLPSHETFVMWEKVFGNKITWGENFYGMFLNHAIWSDFFKKNLNKLTPKERDVLNFLIKEKAFVRQSNSLRIQKKFDLIIINCDYTWDHFTKEDIQKKISQTEYHETCHFFYEHNTSFKQMINGIYGRLDNEVRRVIERQYKKRGYREGFNEEFAADYTGDPDQDLFVKKQVNKLDVVWKQDVKRIDEEFNKLFNKCNIEEYIVEIDK